MYGIFVQNISAEYLSRIFQKLGFFKKFQKCGQHCTLVLEVALETPRKV